MKRFLIFPIIEVPPPAPKEKKKRDINHQMWFSTPKSSQKKKKDVYNFQIRHPICSQKKEGCL